MIFRNNNARDNNFLRRYLTDFQQSIATKHFQQQEDLQTTNQLADFPLVYALSQPGKNVFKSKLNLSVSPY